MRAPTRPPTRSSPPSAAVDGDTAARPRRGVPRALLWLEGLLAVGAYAGAVGLITGGADLGAQATAQLPWQSPAFAGWTLGLINGVLPTVVVIAALARHRWAELGHMAVGAALTGWIVVQVALLGWPPHWLQILYFAWGVAILALALALRRRAAAPPSGPNPRITWPAP